MFSKEIHAADKTILGIYSSGLNAIHAIPGGTERVARVNWQNPITKREYAIDYFLVTGVLEFRPDKKTYIGRLGIDKIAERRFGIQFEIIAQYSGLSRVIRSAAVADILSFLGMTPNMVRSLPNQGSSITVVAHVAPALMIIGHEAKIIATGKQNYIDHCLLDLNIDFSPWCISAMTPDGYFAPWLRCLYCYGAGNAMHFPIIYSGNPLSMVDQIMEAVRVRAANGIPTRVLRVGKKTDGGHPLFRDLLLATLEASCQTGKRAIISTKYLEPDKDVADLLKRSGSILMPSFGCDDLEPGAVLHGRTQQVRVDDGIWYQNRGVITAPFMLIDPTQQDGGPWFAPAVKLVRKHFRRMQFLSIRIRNKELARQVLGGWRSLVMPNVGGASARFEAARNHARIAVTYHSSITKMVGKNNGRVRMCAHNSAESHCGKCFVPREKSVIVQATPAAANPPAAAGTRDQDCASAENAQERNEKIGT